MKRLFLLLLFLVPSAASATVLYSQPDDTGATHTMTGFVATPPPASEIYYTLGTFTPAVATTSPVAYYVEVELGVSNVGDVINPFIAICADATCSAGNYGYVYINSNGDSSSNFRPLLNTAPILPTKETGYIVSVIASFAPQTWYLVMTSTNWSTTPQPIIQLGVGGLPYAIIGDDINDVATSSPFNISETNFWSVSPYNGATVATSAPASPVFNGIGWMTGWKEGTTMNVSFIRVHDLFHCAGVSPSLCTTSASTPLLNLFNTDPPNFSFNATATTTPLSREGDYQITWSVQQPYLSLFGFNFFSKTLTSTTTYLTVGSSTAEDLLYRAISGTSFGSTTATSTPSDCNLFKIGDCVNLLFIPSADSLAFVKLSQIKDTLTRKPPLGYFAAMASLFGNATTSATSTIALSTGIFGSTIITDMLAPLRTGLSVLLWLILALWIFHRLRKWEFQA